MDEDDCFQVAYLRFSTLPCSPHDKTGQRKPIDRIIYAALIDEARRFNGTRTRKGDISSSNRHLRTLDETMLPEDENLLPPITHSPMSLYDYREPFLRLPLYLTDQEYEVFQGMMREEHLCEIAQAMDLHFTRITQIAQSIKEKFKDFDEGNVVELAPPLKWTKKKIREDRERVLVYYRRGYSKYQIARALHLNSSTVYRYLEGVECGE